MNLWLKGRPRLETSFKGLLPLCLEVVSEATAIGAWNEIVDRHHYLGYRRPINPHLRKFIAERQGRQLGLSDVFVYSPFTGVPGHVWTGWQGESHKRHLVWVIQNNHF